MTLSEVAIKRPVFTTMMMLALVVLGYTALTSLAVEEMPKVDFPYVTVQTVYPGAAAETIETEVSKRIEDAVNQISGVRNITSRSQEGYSLVFIEFQLEKDVYDAANDVREKVAGIRGDLPEEIEEPVVSQYDPQARPVLSLTVSGSRPAREITELAKNLIKKRLETVTGVGQVLLIGGSEREVLVALNPERMESYDVSVADVQDAIRAANLEVPGGRVDEKSREYLVRIMGRIDNVSQFNNVIIKNRQGVQVRLQDIGRAVDTTVEQRSLSRFNDKPAVSLGLSKQSGANVVDLAHEARKVIAELKSEVPPDIKIEVVADDSEFIEESIAEINFNIIFGMLLAVIVLYLFLLDFRPTIIAGLSIPISLIATFTVMKMLGFTVNFMTLLGLSLAVGMLIDDAIVVIENIYRHIDEGEAAWSAAFTATKEIGLAVMATTFSIVVVFIPVAFMEGIIGRFFYQFGMSVAFAVIISLFVAFTLTPMLSARWLHKHGDAGPGAHLESGFWRRFHGALGYWNRAFDWFKPKYHGLLAASLRRRWVVMVVAVLSFAGALGTTLFLGSEFLTESDRGQFAIGVSTPPGSTLQQTSDAIASIERIVRVMPEVTSTYVTIGSGNDPVTEGQILLKLVDRAERKLSAKQMMDSVRALIADIPGIETSVSSGEHGGGSNREVEFSVRGEDLDVVRGLARQVQKIVTGVPGTVDIDNSMAEGKPELHVQVDRKAADDLGLNLAAIPMTVRALVEGEVVTRYKEGNEEYDVRMRLDKPYRASAEDIGRILVESNKDKPDNGKLLVPLNRVATITKRSEIGQYDRFNRQREVRVNWNVTSGAFTGTTSNLVLAEVAKMQVPPGYIIEPTGMEKIRGESFNAIGKALFLAVIFIYLLLASQYESFFDPFSIMLSLPLSLIGAFLGLLGSSLSIQSLIGIVLLMGLVTKNAILLIDFVKQQRAKGIPRTEAILMAGPIRLRPILMTTFAMVFGMLPLATGLGPGGEFRAPMARAVIGGVISSTLLTLVVVPVVYTLIDDFVGLFRRRSAVTASVTGKEPAVGESLDRPK
ncbi:MAG: efflux RND transporter permease subunit [Candidatus Zixiibacteriota bacterium]